MCKDNAVASSLLCANQLAAKVMHLHMKMRKQGTFGHWKLTTVQQKRKEELTCIFLKWSKIKKLLNIWLQIRNVIVMRGQGERHEKVGPYLQSAEKIHAGTHVMTQQKYCNFCIESPNWP